MMNQSNTLAQAAGFKEPVSPVQREAMRLSEALGTLDSSLDALERQIGPVLTPAPPESSDTAGARPLPMRCQVADDLSRFADHVESLARSVSALVGRVEV